ncbi:flagellar hook-associated protein FlgK [Rhizobium sp. CFBP 8762]|uniref:flagellar hook-associated protein FlgK n=1 Tax=Rhizobium sp. CFBP 8762 TaxID=2775279 RepID=UPI00177AF456|nr:flagellar hook-associated protein FlgK [Rhizobium sp. CFBP 8762]MBD8553449.1 flagellar hook-associated protein FlgK [Rhizobium sp. CFBP 8762]
MSLASAINTAQSIFNNTGTQTSVISNNIRNSANTDYSRRIAVTGTSSAGANIVKIQRAQDDAIFRQNIESISRSSAQTALTTGLTQLQSLLGSTTKHETAPSTYLGKFQDALQTFAVKPGDSTVAAAAVASSVDVANSLNVTANGIQEIRQNADQEIASTVEDLNTLLHEFEAANNTIVRETATGGDPLDALDERDRVLKQIAEIVGVSTATRAGNDMVLFTNDGSVLFEAAPRAITFTPSSSLPAGIVGQSVLVDGVPLTAGIGPNTTGQGKLAGLLQLRDEIAPVFQKQLDEIARSLVASFAETTTTAGLPPRAGLFSWSQDAIRPNGEVVNGAAASIKVNRAVIATPMLLRDGGVNGSDYIKNKEGFAGYSDQLKAWGQALNAKVPFAAEAEGPTSESILAYSTASVGWLEQNRKAASAADTTKSAMVARTSQALSNQTGVNMEEELSLLMEMEQSYKASAKLVQAVDEMLNALLGMVR